MLFYAPVLHLIRVVLVDELRVPLPKIRNNLHVALVEGHMPS